MALYIIVGVLTTAVDLGLLRVAVGAGVAQPIAVSVAMLTAGTLQFTMFRFVVFRARARPIGLQAGGYFTALVVTWCATVLLVMGFTRVFPISTMAAKLMAIPVIVPLGFLVNRYVIFRR